MSTNNLTLRLLDPTTDLDLYRQAFAWRKPKAHISGPQMAFEAFSADKPTRLTIGLFNGELQAVYFLREFEPKCYESHFTSRKGVSREVLVWGAKRIIELLLENGAAEICALILAGNRPLRRFVVDIGMTQESQILFTCVKTLQESNIFSPRNQREMFIKYAARA